METAIEIFERISRALGTLQIQSTPNNCNVVLGCMQLCNQGIAAIQEERSNDRKTDIPSEQASD